MITWRAKGPRVFGVAPGVDFARSVAREISSLYSDQPPEDLAKVVIFANSARMRRELTTCFSDGRALLLPKIFVVSDLVPLVPDADLPPPTRSIERHLDVVQLLKPVLSGPSAPAPTSAIHDLAESLTALMDEMRTENASADDLLSLDVADQAEHWALAQRFLRILDTYFQASGTSLGDNSNLQRMALEHLITKWRSAPPTDPVFVVGSTGSRGTTFELMKAVADLPKGALVLPGFDFDMPSGVWSSLSKDTATNEDHAQFRYAALMDALQLECGDVVRWPEPSPDTIRNKLVSLSLRPAPVTNLWREEGPHLGDLVTATKGLALVEAPQPREEANAIAVGMRKALAEGRASALVTPDRTLARRVTAALGRWGIRPDDSAGMPLSLSPPGRFLRLIARMLGQSVEPGHLIAILRHPLCRTGTDDRGDHVRWTNELELSLRRVQRPHVSADFVTKQGEFDESRIEWCRWVTEAISLIEGPFSGSLSDYSEHLLSVSEFMARGANDGAGRLWDLEAGEKALFVLEEFRATGSAGPEMTGVEFQRLLDHALSNENVRNSETVRTDVKILGALEARVLDADVVFLGGLNEGVWPSNPSPDPWLSRRMRREVGLLSPERQIGLSAHDFQQAVCGVDVVMTRSLRDEDAETVPSRWVNRLTNLLGGLPDTRGPEALKQMRSRGEQLLSAARRLEAPRGSVDPASRPSPAPPSHVRPTSLSVTTVEKLIRDPYWIYCRHILNLKPLNPLVSAPSAALRGAVFHKVVEQFVGGIRDGSLSLVTEDFLRVAENVVLTNVPWGPTQRVWLGHLTSISEEFVANEIMRLESAKNLGTEIKGRLEIPETPFVITAEADRIDAGPDGRLIIYDYKSGSIPTRRQTKQFNPQILLEAIIAEGGGFEQLQRAEVAEGSYVSLGRNLSVTQFPLTDGVPLDKKTGAETGDFRVETAVKQLVELLDAYAQSNQGYQSRRAMEKMRFEGDYDHLARFGEWDETQDPVTVVIS